MTQDTSTQITPTTANTSVGTFPTDREQTEKGFLAPERLRSSLQAVLVNLIDLQLMGKQAHWNIVGTNFRDLHLNLDELVGVTRSAADAVAERLRALHATPDGRTSVVARDTELPTFPAGEVTTHDAIRTMVLAIDVTVRRIRTVHDGVDADDPTSADLLHSIIGDLEQQSWFIGAEVRTPASRAPQAAGGEAGQEGKRTTSGTVAFEDEEHSSSEDVFEPVVK